MRNYKIIVIIKAPRGKKGTKKSAQVLIHLFFVSLSILFTWIVFSVIHGDFFPFIKKISNIKMFQFDGKIIGMLFFPIFYLAIIIAAIRNNTKSQPVESFLVIFSLCFAAFFFLFGTPAMFLWAHWNGYVLDHYEATHRGGWYFFKLAGK
ncbi:hypothetical protein A0U92_05630 [Acetobacter aceti]|uniref:Uncharacterized protein n=1 Tax=Acetobacter aceti TaxID=435 RepID=A0A1U9KEV5_ACEAC|nr:hypothetical protein [Acetobacter aceti]AQS84340.1 hypothetical protein A0U92_05630 [Acetobacter aceti]